MIQIEMFVVVVVIVVSVVSACFDFQFNENKENVDPVLQKLQIEIKGSFFSLFYLMDLMYIILEHHTHVYSWKLNFKRNWFYNNNFSI